MTSIVVRVVQVLALDESSEYNHQLPDLSDVLEYRLCYSFISIV